MLSATVPAGSTLVAYGTPTGGATSTLDFIQLEQATPIANPDPTKYVAAAAFDQNVDPDRDQHGEPGLARSSASTCRPALPVSSKFQVSQKALEVVGAGPWFTRLLAPPGQDNTDIGFSPSGAGATGSSFRDFALFGNYNSRQDGAGQAVRR